MVLSFDELRAKLTAAEKRAREAESRAQAKEVDEGDVLEILRLRSLGINELWAKHVGDEEFVLSWKPRHEAWEAGVEKKLREAFGPTWAGRLRDLGELPGRRYVSGGLYNRHKNMLSKELEILDELLKSYGNAPTGRE
jgi:hypothetical protein